MRKKRRVIAALMMVTLLLSDVQMVALAEDVGVSENETLELPENLIQDEKSGEKEIGSEESGEEDQEDGEKEDKADNAEEGNENSEEESEADTLQQTVEDTGDVLQQETDESQMEITERDVQGDYQYTVDSLNMITITGYTGNESVLSIPANIDGRTVKTIGYNAFQDCTEITKIEIPSSVKSIQGGAFCGCRSLTEVEIPSTVKTIESQAFMDCENLTKITLNDGLLSLGENFIGNTEVKEITIPKTVETMSYALYGAQSLTKVIFGNGMEKIPDKALESWSSSPKTKVAEVVLPASVKTIGSSAFYECENLKGIKLPENLNCIESHAFNGCTGLKEIKIPSSVTEIKENAFGRCTGITGVEIPSKVKKISGGTFMGCTGLTEVEIPSTVKTIESQAFMDCENLTKITLNDGLLSIGENFIGNTEVKEITVPKTVETMEYALYGTQSLTKVIFGSGMEKIPKYALYARWVGSSKTKVSEVILPASIKTIGTAAFYECENLKGIKLPENLNCIEDSAFYGCIGLKEIKLPSSVTEIKENAFGRCTGITGVKIPSKVKKISDGTFMGCTGLTEVEIPSTVKTIESQAFMDCENLTKITLNDGLLSIGENFIGNTEVKEITIPKTVETMEYALYGAQSLTKVIFGSGMEKIPKYALYARWVGSSKTKVSEVILPASIKTIGTAAFYECENLKGIKLPENLNCIEDSAFYGCIGLKEIKLPSSVTEIKENAFGRCTGITGVKIPSKVKKISGGTFMGCTGLTEVEIPSTVKTIESQAFMDCENLTKIMLNDGLLSIGENFIGNTEVKEITIPKTVETMEYALYGAQSLTKVIFGSGMEKIPKYALYARWVGSSKTKVSEVILPASIKTIGTAALYECENLKGIKLPENLNCIEDSAFYGCIGLKEIKLPSNVTEIKENAFGRCTGITGVEIPSKVKKISGGTFMGCTGLTEVEIPSTVKTIESQAFMDCENLTKIMLNDGLLSIGENFIENTEVKEITIPKTVETMNYALYGAQSLARVIFGNGMEKIPDYALYSGSSTIKTRVKEIIIPASVKVVGYGAFGDFKGTLTLMSEDSGASIYAIDNELAYEAKKNGISDSPDRYLARNKSFYTTSLSSSTTSGYVNLNLQYEFKDEAKKSISNKGMQLKIKIPSAVTLASNTFKLNGKKTGVTPDENGYIYVPVENTKGSATFSLKISDVSYLMTYAQIEYQYQGENKCETIGIVNMAKKIFTLSVPDKTSEAKVDVLGFTEPGQSVQLYFEGNMVQTVKASNTGSYMATMNIPDPQEGNIYKIEAKTVSGEEESSAIAYTKYTKNSVQLTQCIMYYRNQSYDLLSLAGTRPVISWANGTIFTFKVAFSDNSNVGDVNIVSTKGGEVNKLRAVWNEKQKAYIAAGFSGYVPGNITVEYGKNLGVGFDGNQVSLGEPFDEKGIIGYESKVTLKDIPEFYYLKEQEEKVSKLPSGDYERMDYDGSICYLSKEIEYRTKGDKTYACQEIFIKQEDDSYIRLCTGIGLEKKQSSKQAKAKFAKADVIDVIKELKNLIDLLSDVSEDTEDAEVYVMLEKTISAAMSSVTPSSAEYYELVILKTKLETVEMMDGSRKAYSKINKIIENAEKSNDNPEWLPTDKITDKMKEAVDEMNRCSQNITNRHLREVMEELTKGGWFSDSLLEKVIDNLEKDAENTDMNFNARYSIDPSGYVYEAVTDNRLEGVKATIYYKDAENSTAVLWNAEEYDQSNPLYTDDLGYYAWDVPEGLWQVKFEKEGYETTSSEWLPVPPPQLEVNKGMVSKEKPKIEKMVAYSDHIEIVFSKYMMPDTVAALKITDQEGKAISYNLEYDKKSVDESGANFAREYHLIFKDGKALEPGTACKVLSDTSLKSYAGIVMDAHEYSSNVQKNIEIIAPDTVSVKMGETIEVPVQVANSSEKVQMNAVSEFEEIASVSKAGKDSITILGNMYGSTKITIKIEGIDIQKEIKVNVGTDSKLSDIKKKVILPQSVYTMSKGESIKIVPEIYPDSSAKGKWTLSGDRNIISLDGDNFRADNVGEVTARYTLDGNEDIFAECKIIVISKAVKGDIDGDGKINLVDLMMCLNHVSKKKLLEGTAFEAADIDGKNGVNLVDLMRILNYVSKKSSSL